MPGDSGSSGAGTPLLCQAPGSLSLRMALPPNLPQTGFLYLRNCGCTSPESAPYTCIQVETTCVRPRSNILGEEFCLLLDSSAVPGGRLWGKDYVLVSCCYRNKYHRLRGLKQHINSPTVLEVRSLNSLL